MNVFFSGYGEFNRKRVIGPARWPHFDLLFIHSGKIELTIQGEYRPLIIEQRQAVLLYPHTRFHGKSLSDTTKASVHHFHFSLPATASLAEHVNCTKGYQKFDAGANDQIERDLDRSLRLKDGDPLVPAAQIQSHLLNLCLIQLQHQLNAPLETQSPLYQVVCWLQLNLNRPISLCDMAAQAKLSESHFRRVFRQTYGSSPVEYHRRLRIDEAKRQLTESLTPIKVISDNLGFEDLAHFYRSFKKFTSIPPAEYRRQSSFTG